MLVKDSWSRLGKLQAIDMPWAASAVGVESRQQARRWASRLNIDDRWDLFFRLEREVHS